MVDMNPGEIASFTRAIARCMDVEVATHARASLHYVQLRAAAVTKGEKYRYVNVAGGSWDASAKQYSSSLVQAKAYLSAQGLGRFLDVVPGPLFRATFGALLTHMPLTTSSSYAAFIGALKKAWEISSSMAEPDEELDLDGLEKPKWGHQTFRRTADKIARATAAETGASKEDIDDMFGWRQAERAKEMQSHYAGFGSRAHRAKITMMI